MKEAPKKLPTSPNKHLSIVSSAQKITVLMIALFAFSLILLVFASKYMEQKQRSEQMRKSHVSRQKDTARREVERVVESIRERRANCRKEAVTKAKQRVHQALVMAEGIYQASKEKKSPEEIVKLVLSALRPVRFDQGNGYYFVGTLKGNVLLLYDRPDIEGKHYSAIASKKEQAVVSTLIDLVKWEGEGILEYEWTMPGKKGADHPKISYAKLFTPCDLVIGTGLYLEDVEALEQREILEEIAKIKFGKNGYFFVNNLLDGTVLTHGDLPDLVGHSIWDYTDSHGVNVFQELLQAVKNPQGGYSFYWWRKPETGKERPKIAFAMAVPEWEWLVGTGLYLDDVEADVQKMNDRLRQQSMREVVLILLIMAVIIVLVYHLMGILFRSLRRDMAFFTDCFSLAAEQDAFIDETRIKFTELINIARNANEMLKEKAKIQKKLHEDKQKLEQLNIELARSNKDLEHFAYVASHDLQEPLRMVSSYTRLLERRYKDKLDQDAIDFIGFAVDGSNRMQNLIQDLLSYSQVTTRGKEMDDIDAQDALGGAVENLHFSIKETSAMITSDDLPIVHADRSQLISVFQNLIGNAIKFRKTETSPRIHVSARKENNKWLFSVQDNGIGIDEQYKDQIFLIFQRLLSRKDYAGTGIGLSLCRRIVERHGGKIWMESIQGKGSVFYFTMPITIDK